MTTARPLIGISCDWDVRQVRGVDTVVQGVQHYYVRAVQEAGGISVLLPALAPEHAEAVLGPLSGLVLSGGDFDVDPALYGEAPHPKLGHLRPERTGFELALLQVAERRRLPVLGICGGMQVMNVFRGGSLVQHIDGHQQLGDKRAPWHPLQVLAPLVAALGDEPLPANSTHHQVVARLGRGLQPAALAPDGVCEAFVSDESPFFVGVQWHPEAMLEGERHLGLYRALVRAAVGLDAGRGPGAPGK